MLELDVEDAELELLRLEDIVLKLGMDMLELLRVEDVKLELELDPLEVL